MSEADICKAASYKASRYSRQTVGIRLTNDEMYSELIESLSSSNSLVYRRICESGSAFAQALKTSKSCKAIFSLTKASYRLANSVCSRHDLMPERLTPAKIADADIWTNTDNATPALATKDVTQMGISDPDANNPGTVPRTNSSKHP